MQERHSNIDVLKAISCIAVVLIHYNFPGGWGTTVKTICRVGVPFFFFVSGYFLLNKQGCFSTETIMRKCKHILQILITASLFYLVFFVGFNLLVRPSFDVMVGLQERVNIYRVIKLILTNDPFVYGHLWFLSALIYSYLSCIAIFRIKLLKDNLFITSVVLLMGFLIFSNYNTVLGLRNVIPLQPSKQLLLIGHFFVFRALPFFLLGIVFRQNEERIRSLNILSKGNIILFIVIGSLLSVVERGLIGKESQYYIGTYMVMFLMFALALEKGNFKVPFIKPLSFLGENLSTDVYIYHFAIGPLVGFAAGKLRILGNLVYIYSKAFVILLATIIFAYLIWSVKEYFHAAKVNVSK